MTFLFTQNFIEQIAIAPLKLQKQRDLIFRNIKEILVVHRNHILPDIETMKEADDVAKILLKSVRTLYIKFVNCLPLEIL